MNNSGLKKIVPAFDMLLLLVVILFSITGLRRSGPPPEITKARLERLLTENKSLQSGLEASEAEAGTLEDKLHTMKELNRDGKSLEMLGELAASAEEEMREAGEAETTLTDMKNELAYVRKAFQERYQLHEAQASLESEARALELKIKQRLAEKTELERKVSEADLRRAAAQKLKDKIEQIEEETNRLKERDGEIRQGLPKVYPRWGGDYYGPFLLLECDSQGVLAHPGNKRIPLAERTDNTKWLESEIKRIGAAVLVVRPSGFRESYPMFYTLLTEVAKKDKEETSQRELVLSFWPIEANESIEPYLPKEYRYEK